MKEVTQRTGAVKDPLHEHPKGPRSMFLQSTIRTRTLDSGVRRRSQQPGTIAAPFWEICGLDQEARSFPVASHSIKADFEASIKGR